MSGREGKREGGVGTVLISQMAKLRLQESVRFPEVSQPANNMPGRPGAESKPSVLPTTLEASTHIYPLTILQPFFALTRLSKKKKEKKKVVFLFCFKWRIRGDGRGYQYNWFIKQINK